MSVSLQVYPDKGGYYVGYNYGNITGASEAFDVMDGAISLLFNQTKLTKLDVVIYFEDWYTHRILTLTIPKYVFFNGRTLQEYLKFRYSYVPYMKFFPKGFVFSNYAEAMKMRELLAKQLLWDTLGV